LGIIPVPKTLGLRKLREESLINVAPITQGLDSELHLSTQI